MAKTRDTHNFDSEMLEERADTWRIIQYAATDDGAIILKSSDNKGFIGLMPIGPEDEESFLWIKIAAILKGKIPFMSFTIDGIETILEDIREDHLYDGYHVIAGLDMAIELGFADESGHLKEA